MTNSIKAAALAATAALALSGCASIVSGQTDMVKIDSSPSGQECIVYRGKETVARVVTPQTVPIERGTESLLVVCGDSREREDDGFNGWMLGNLFLFPPVGTIVGLLVDGSTGASRGYDDVMVGAGR